MEVLVVWWLGTVIASIGMEISHELRVFKDIADAGYKCDLKRVNELSEHFSPDSSKKTLISLLVIGYNIFYVFDKANKYNNTRPMLLSQLDVAGVLEEMTDEEKKEYLKKPTGLNAIKIQIKSERNLTGVQTLEIKKKNDKGKIIYRFNDTYDDVTVLKATGTLARLTEEEQKKRIMDSWKNFVKSGVEQYGGEEEFIKALKSNSNLHIEKKEENKPSSLPELDISEQKQALEEFKEELLNGQEVTEASYEEEGPTLIKRKKNN